MLGKKFLPFVKSTQQGQIDDLTLLNRKSETNHRKPDSVHPAARNIGADDHFSNGSPDLPTLRFLPKQDATNTRTHPETEVPGPGRQPVCSVMSCTARGFS